MQCDGATDLMGDLMVKSVMGKPFDVFRKILREQKLDSYFRKSCFGKYLDLLEDNNARFQMKMVYDLLKRRFMYENKYKMDEVWINYCGMPICFGWEEFAIVTGLKCYPPFPSQVIPTLTPKKAPRTPKKGKDKSSNRDDQVSIAGPSFKNKNLIEAVKGLTFKAIPYLKQQVNYQEEVSCPRILRWLSAKTNKNAKFLDLFNPPKEAVDVTATAEKHNMTVDNPSTASKDEEKVEPVNLGERKNYLFKGFNISNQASKKLIQLINDYLEWIVDGLLKHYAGRKQNDERYKVNESSLGFDMFDFVVAHPKMKNWFYLMSQPQTCWNGEPEVSQNEACLIHIIKGFSIPAGLPWHLVDDLYIPINCGDEFHWVLTVIILKEKCIRVYDLMSRKRHSESSSEIQKLAKILPTYLDMSGFLDQKVRTDWSMIEAYRDKMANPFDVQYVDGIAQQTIGSLDCGPFVAVYAEYLSDVLQVPNDGLDAGLLRKRYAALLWKYGEAKAQKSYAIDVKDPRRPKSNSIALDEEQLVHID
ncbi:hypothetical protein BC332_32096 [Capsicum chinense]|nr:hypothetical protein BC332_32096 [Capsicum chinense]